MRNLALLTILKIYW